MRNRLVEIEFTKRREPRSIFEWLPDTDRYFMGYQVKRDIFDKPKYVPIIRVELLALDGFIKKLFDTGRDFIKSHPVHEKPQNYYSEVPRVLDDILELGAIIGYTDGFMEAFTDLAASAYEEDWRTVGYDKPGTFKSPVIDPYTWDWGGVDINGTNIRLMVLY